MINTQPVTDVRRPPGRGHGLEGPACPERADLDQGYNPHPPRQAMCILCGRVTARRDTDDMPWCGGDSVAGKPDTRMEPNQVRLP